MLHLDLASLLPTLQDILLGNHRALFQEPVKICSQALRPMRDYRAFLKGPVKNKFSASRSVFPLLAGRVARLGSNQLNCSASLTAPSKDTHKEPASTRLSFSLLTQELILS